MSSQNKLTPGDDTESNPEQRLSILEKLHDKQLEISTKSTDAVPTRAKEKSNDVSL